MSTPSFSEQLNQLWRTRPARLPRQGPVAGVAAGIGHRYDVDPVLVRVAFVVSTLFGGAGIVLYLAGWLLLPRAGDPTSAAESLVGRGHSSESGTKTIVLVVALLIAVSTLGPIGVNFGGSGLISMALMLGGLWLLFQRRPEPPALPAGTDPWFGITQPASGFPGTVGPATGQYTAPGVFTTLPQSYQPDSESTTAASTPTPPPGEPQGSSTPDPIAPAAAADPREHGPTDPPAWDPLGVAPFAWDLPEPAPAPAPVSAPRSRPKSRLTSVVIGLAILASVAAWAIGAATDGTWMTPGRIGAVGLAVIGAGMVVGAFLRRGYGLLVVTGPLAGFVVLASLIGPIDWSSHNVGSRTWTPLTAADLEPEYTSELGDFVLDLRGVTLTEDKTVAVEAGVGTFTVLVPENMNVVNHCSIAIGDVRCLPEGLSGGSDGTDGPVLTLNMDGRIGDLEVRRG
ncbi:PspC domain-containing protein [Rhodococcus sp. NPDC058505]|uniref:PspC domain-containing protein n=1 Tax=unclassified Rhodococcus (in: high G+C Gram-positive bacteria) TaxID=192944 RepID=UPI00365FF761